MWNIERDAQGITGAHDEQAAHVGAGMAAYIEAHALTGTDSLIPAGEVYDAAGHGLVALNNGDVLTWHDGAVHDNEAGQIVARQYAQIAALTAEIAAEKAKAANAAPAPTPAPVPAPAPTPAPVSEPEADPDRLHIWQNGQTLADISTEWFGTPDGAAAILAANRDRVHNPDAVSVGMALVIPAEISAAVA